MTAAQLAKSFGLSSLTEVQKITGVNRQTLDNWYKTKPILFNIVLQGCIAVKSAK